MCGISCLVKLNSNSQPTSLTNSAATQLNNGTCLPTNATSETNGVDSASSSLLEQLNASLDRIEHRGPDSRGHWISDNERIALGHVRLSINDLSPTGAQPFHSPDNKIHAVVNGELYNDEIRTELESKYPFKGTSDCEVAIAAYLAYGVDFLNHLRGEFAICLWDEERQLFIAARDRYGIKPLYYTITSQGGETRLLVAAEVKAFSPLGWQPAWDVASIVQGGWNFDNRTLFKDVRKVKPGHYLEIRSYGKVEEKPFWDLDFPDKRELDPRGVEELIEGVRERLLDAVRVRLKADVKVGIYLSGGIDSSVIAGMVTHLVKERGVRIGAEDPMERVSCFSIAFDEESGFDESSIANRTAEFLGVKYYKKHMSEEELAKRFEDATYHCEHHNADLNYVGKFALSELPPEHDFKVVLTGEGSDEIFAGYPMYLPDYLREPDPRCSDQSLPEERRSTLQQEAENDLADYYARIGARSVMEPTKARAKLNNISTPASMTAFQPVVFAEWVSQHFGFVEPQDTIAAAVGETVMDSMAHKWHPLHSGLYVWSKGHLANQFLSCLGDRTEMAHSLEARTPFLDHHLTEYVAGIAPSWKVRWQRHESGDDGPDGRFVEKWILREASKPFITEELYQRKKHPYTAPTTYPAEGPLHKVFARLLTKTNVESLGFADWAKVEGLLNQAFEGRDARSLRQAMMVAQWVVIRQRFGCMKAGPETLS